jgi:hypothetical protein
MRRKLLSASLFLFAATLAPQALHATGNVLLPKNDSGNPSSFLNLGLGLQPPSSAPAADTKTPLTPSVPEPPAAAPVPVPAPMPTPPASPDSPHIFHETYDPGQPDPSLPKGITIVFSDKSSFSANDVAEISKKLGLSRNQIASSCNLSLRGFIQTEKNRYMASGWLSPQIPVRYDGTINKFQAKAVALCPVNGPLPPGNWSLTEIDDRFVVPLQAISCGGPKGRVNALVITYDGSNAAPCAYQ